MSTVISIINNQGDVSYPRKQHLILTDAAISYCVIRS